MVASVSLATKLWVVMIGVAIGTELLLEEFGHQRISDWVRFGVLVSIILFSLAYFCFRLLSYYLF